MKKILVVIIIFLSIGCSKPRHSVEIYLLESRVKNKIGISYEDFLKKSKHDSIEIIGKYTTYDTINNKRIFAGEFDISKCKLKSEPLLKSEEIEYLDLKENKIRFSKSGALKINSLPGTHMIEGIQFVITDNKVPIFSGYFWNDFSSYGSDWNCISYAHNIKGMKRKVNLEHSIFKGNGMGYWKDNSINFNQYPELLKVFEETNKLKK